MANYSFSLNLEAWVRYLEIEATSYKEALAELKSMTISDLIKKGNVQDFDISDFDVELLVCDYKVNITNITWNNTNSNLPTQAELDIYDVNTFDDEEENIKEAIIERLESKYKCKVVDFDFEVVENLSAGPHGEGTMDYEMNFY